MEMRPEPVLTPSGSEGEWVAIPKLLFRIARDEK